jgi:CheY-like chemotaxis protein
MSPTAISSKRVLLVEDDRFLRKAAETTLRNQGLTVVTAVDGEQALELARETPPHLILLDLLMPKLHGFAVLQALKEDPRTAGIPVIVLSNLGQDTDLNAALALGATSFLVKANLSLHDLALRVHEALAASGSPLPH